MDIKQEAPSMNDEYPNSDFPYTFYFNGEEMPKWGACWGLARLARFIDPSGDCCEDVSHRDVYIVYCTIDHVGVVESADPDIFVYAIQEVICILLSKREEILDCLKGRPEEVYTGLVDAAFRMRELAVRDHCAFWTSGYETDREQLLERIRRCRLPPGATEFTLPPHVQKVRSMVKSMQKHQIRNLHQLAQSGKFSKDLRRRLNEMRVD